MNVKIVQPYLSQNQVIAAFFVPIVPLNVRYPEKSSLMFIKNMKDRNSVIRNSESGIT